MTPSAIILRDPSRKELTVLDMKLIVAAELAEQFMRGTVPIYWDESDRVAFDVGVGISKSRAAVERKQDRVKPKDKNFGVYYYPIARSIDGDPLPTLEEWVAEKRAKAGN